MHWEQMSYRVNVQNAILSAFILGYDSFIFISAFSLFPSKNNLVYSVIFLTDLASSKTLANF